MEGEGSSSNFDQQSLKGDESLVLAALTLILSLALVLVCIAAGWYVMWKLFLSRFQFITEIMKSDQEIVLQNKTKRKVRRD